MARGMKPRKKEQAARAELLSAYLDDQLDAEERARLEARLADDAALRAELEALRRTVEMVRDLPSQPVPRNFILPRTTAPKPQRPPVAHRRLRWAAPFLTAATAVVSLLFVVVLAGDLLLSGTVRMAHAPGVAEQKLTAPSPAAEAIAVEEAPAAPAPGGTPPQVTEAERETMLATALPKAAEPADTADDTPSTSPTPGSYGPVAGNGEDKEEGGERAEATAEPSPAAGGGVTEGTGTPTPTAAPLAAEVAPAQTATPVPAPAPEESLRSPAPAPSGENDIVPTASVEGLADAGGERTGARRGPERRG